MSCTRVPSCAMRFPAVLFDLDGTITNSERGIVESMRHAAERWGLDLEGKDLSQLIGPPLQDVFADTFNVAPSELDRVMNHARGLNYVRKVVNYVKIKRPPANS